jgi:hypothetical protein
MFAMTVRVGRKMKSLMASRASRRKKAARKIGRLEEKTKPSADYGE